MTRVVVVEDHTLVRQSLMKAIAAEPGFEVVGGAGRGDDAMLVVKERSPDLLLLDINLPGEDGLQVAERLKSQAPGVRVIILTMHEDEASIRRAVGVGVEGYVPKSASTEELLHAMRAVASGGSYLAPSVARRVMDMAGGRGAGPLAHFTPRELEILRLLAEGARTQQVAEALFLSVKTVKNHLTSVYAKLGVETAAQAVAVAYRLGLVAGQEPG